MDKGFSVAIDGPVASGKGTLAKALNKKLGGVFIDTGAMYRCVAMLSLNRGIDLKNEEEVIRVLPEVNVKFENGRIFLNSQDVSENIRVPEVSTASSVISSHPLVRQDMVAKQQEIAKEAIDQGKVVIMEGRDIGTRVLPNSDFKLFLNADPKVRAERRVEQYKEKGSDKSFDEVLEDTQYRDNLDLTRDTDPLPSNPEELGYFVLDNTKQSAEESIDTILNELKTRGILND